MTTPLTGKTVPRTCYLDGRHLHDYRSGRRIRLATAKERAEGAHTGPHTRWFLAHVSLRTWRRATDQLAAELAVARAQDVAAEFDDGIPF